MSEEFKPLWQELPLPSPDDRRLFEEWVRRKEHEKLEEEKGDDQRVIVIEI